MVRSAKINRSATGKGVKPNTAARGEICGNSSIFRRHHLTQRLRASSQSDKRVAPVMEARQQARCALRLNLQPISRAACDLIASQGACSFVPLPCAFVSVDIATDLLRTWNLPKPFSWSWDSCHPHYFRLLKGNCYTVNGHLERGGVTGVPSLESPEINAASPYRNWAGNIIFFEGKRVFSQFEA